mmetsp:Transcript_106621/g.217546  ORF Transcript_106621/g.217546 Transcript_106621/m.217546 type:complete len:93 (+) Transcript_106621:1357-1635(+)
MPIPMAARVPVPNTSWTKIGTETKNKTSISTRRKKTTRTLWISIERDQKKLNSDEASNKQMHNNKPVLHNTTFPNDSRCNRGAISINRIVEK